MQFMLNSKFILLAVFFLFGTYNLKAQSSIYLCDDSGDVLQVNLTTCVTSLVATSTNIFTDIAYSPTTGMLFCITQSGYIYQINPTTGAISFWSSFNVVGNFSTFNSLTCDLNGNLYASAYDMNTPGAATIYTYDFSTNSSTSIGNLPLGVEPDGDLAFLNGQLVLTTYSNELYSIDISNPGLSTSLGSFQNIVAIYGITGLNCGQETIISTGNNLYSLNTTTFTQTLICTLPAIGIINGLTSATESMLDVDLGQDSTFCAAGAITLDALNSGANYLWSTGSMNQQISVSTPGTFWVQVDNNGCIGEDTISIAFLVPPSIFLGNDTILCPNSSLLLDAQNPGASYLWQDNSINQTTLVNQQGIYSVEVTMNNCTSTDSIQISYYSNPIDLGPDEEICTALTIDPGNIATTYLWSDGSTAQTLTANAVGVYWLQITNGSCVFSDTIELSLGSITTGLPATSVLCSGGNLVLDANNPAATFLWQDGSTNQQLVVTTSGVYSVVVNSGLCQTTDSTLVSVSTPVVFFEVADTIGCAPLTTSFFDLSTSNLDPIVSWQWQFGDATSSTVQNPTHTYPNSGFYTVTLSVLTANGCQTSYTRTVEIQIQPSPIADFSFLPIEPEFGEEVVFTDQSTSATTWNWSFGNGDTSALQNPTYNFENSGTHTISLEVSNQYGCSDTIQVMFHLSFDIPFYLPNTFTPNGDEFNNYFCPVFGNGLDETQYHFMIYNRWGELIFESLDHEIGWDGTYDGQNVQCGTFVWLIKFGNLSNAGIVEASGHVNLLR